MAETLARREPAKLSFHDGEVMVTPKDRDIFFISAEKATEACRDVIRQEERVTRFTEGVIRPLVDWCETHKNQISACYLLVPESSVLPVYVVGASEQYNFNLTEEMSELAFQFEDRGWSVHLSQIPLCDVEQLRGFFSLDHAIQVYG